MSTQETTIPSECIDADEQSLSAILNLLRQLLPQTSVADIGQSGYARVQFDRQISDMLEAHAKHRSPADTNTPDRDYRNHLIGIASEIAVATWQEGEIDRQIYPDYEGDGGVDVTAPSKWRPTSNKFQIKGTRDVTNPEQTVSPTEVEKADILVLCCTNAPASYVDIVGYIQSPLLEAVGQLYGRERYLLSPEHLYPVKPTLYNPDDVRSVLYD